MCRAPTATAGRWPRTPSGKRSPRRTSSPFSPAGLPTSSTSRASSRSTSPSRVAAATHCLSALGGFAKRSGHPELATAPFLMWGMSAGGQFNYEFVAWKPERVVAFVVNKGGIYYSALLSRAAREVPGMLFIGGKDLAFRNNTISGLFRRESSRRRPVGVGRGTRGGTRGGNVARRVARVLRGRPSAQAGSGTIQPSRDSRRSRATWATTRRGHSRR